MVFKSFEFIVNNDVQADYSIEAKPAIAIGWIPHYRSLSGLPANSEFRSHPASAGRIGISPLEAMFSTGNPTDQWLTDPAREVFKGGREDVVMFAKTKNFRALLAIDSLRAWFGENGEFAKVTFEAVREVGYTRLVGPMGYVRHLKGTVRGPGGSTWHEAFTDHKNGIHIVRFWLRYKIGRLCDLVGWAVSGKWAPSAYVQMEYQFTGKSPSAIGFVGTHIPSVSMYVDWTGVSKYDMVGADRDQIDGFLKAGRCADAPDELLYVWHPASEFGQGI